MKIDTRAWYSLQIGQDMLMDIFIVGRCDLSAIRPIHFVSIVLFRVMRRSDHDPGQQMFVWYSEGNEWRGNHFTVQIHRNAFVQKYTRW